MGLSGSTDIGWGDGRHGKWANKLILLLCFLIIGFRGHAAVEVLTTISIRGETNRNNLRKFNSFRECRWVLRLTKESAAIPVHNDAWNRDLVISVTSPLVSLAYPQKTRCKYSDDMIETTTSLFRASLWAVLEALFLLAYFRIWQKDVESTKYHLK